MRHIPLVATYPENPIAPQDASQHWFDGIRWKIMRKGDVGTTPRTTPRNISPGGLLLHFIHTPLRSHPGTHDLLLALQVSMIHPTYLRFYQEVRDYACALLSTLSISEISIDALRCMPEILQGGEGRPKRAQSLPDEQSTSRWSAVGGRCSIPEF